MFNPNHQHDSSHLFSRPDQINEPLYVVTSVFNAVRYRTRWKLYQDFKRMVEASGAILYTVEVAFGEREFSVTDECDPHDLQLRTHDELWLKENSWNLMAQRLPSDWKYVAFLDADISFARGDWANEIKHQLQHYPVIQPWSESVDLDSDYEILNRFRSYAWCYKNGIDIDLPGDYYTGARKKRMNYFHPGYGMCWRRYEFDKMGGMIDWAILGGADLLMWRGLTGLDRQLPKSLGEHGKRMYAEWCHRADKYIKKNVGYVPGLIDHYWHGAKANRKYKDRGMILVDANFNPETDVYRDSQGLWQLNEDAIQLRDGIRDYFRQRQEDQLSHD